MALQSDYIQGINELIKVCMFHSLGMNTGFTHMIFSLDT